jgi:hypothetical protein
VAKGILPEALQQKQAQLQIAKEVLDQSPAKQLEKYVSKSGDFKGGLKEVTGTGTKFAKQGDEFAQQAGFADSETAREAFLKYQNDKEILRTAQADLKQEIASIKKPAPLLKVKSPLTQSAQKAVAEGKTVEEWIKGQGTPVYHGSPIDNLKEIGFGMGIRGNSFMGKNVETKSPAIFFTENKKTADFFAKDRLDYLKEIGKQTSGKGTTYESYINLKNPLDLTNIKKTDEVLHSLGISVEREILGTEPYSGTGIPLTDLIKSGDIKPDELFTLLDKKEIVTKLKNAGYDGAKALESGDRGISYAVFDPSQIKTRSQLTALYEQAKKAQSKTPQKISSEGIPLALSKKEKEIVASRGDSTLSRQSEISRGEAKSIEIQAEQARSITKSGNVPVEVSLPKIIADTVTPVKNRVNIIDTFLRTPDRVMAKIGLKSEARELRIAMDGYWKELPQNIKKIEQWQKEVPKESNVRIFKFLDGQAIDLRPEEQKVADEVKTWLSQWASRLKLGSDNRISDYITHIFDKEFSQKGFDEELAKIITDKVPGSVYNPFTLKRLGAKGYKQDTWLALDAYVKRGTRKVYLDPVLEKLQSKVGSSLDVTFLEESQWKFVQKYVSNINMRPTDLDKSIDNVVRSFTDKFGTRPVTTVTKTLRQMTFLGMLGGNPGSALRNLSQGVNNYAILGEKYTAIGYTAIFKKGAMAEMEREGVLNAGFIQDKVLSATRKKIQQADKVLFAFFDGAERINRGSAYFGAKAKGLSLGYSEEQAIQYAKSIVRKTQFVFDSVDTPVGMGSDIAKTLFQFQTYTTKQIEFLTEMAKDKNFVGLLRYAVAGTAFVYTIGKAFGMEPKELIPWYRFDTPPSAKFPVEVGKALVNAPDKYGNQRDLQQKISDVGKSTIGLIPAGTQIKKSLEGTKALLQGKSTDAAGRAQFDVGGTTAKNIQAFLFGKYAGEDAKAYFDGKKYAESQYEKLQNSPTKKEDWAKIVKDDPNLAKAVARVKEKIDLGITEEDDKILALGVQNKARAKFVADKVKSLKTKEEKKALIVEYIKKKIITDQVSEQLLEMLK